MAETPFLSSGRARQGSNVATANAHSIHTQFLRRVDSLRTKTVPELAPGVDVTHALHGAGVVTAVFDHQGVKKATVFFEALEAGKMVEMRELVAAGRGRQASRLSRHESAGAESAASGDDDWHPYEYVPGKSVRESLELLLLGEMFQRQTEDGVEYKRSFTWLNTLLAFVPLSFIANYGMDVPTFTFISAFFAIIPLAGILGHLTEDLAGHVGSALGALLNASFGNATELMIAFFAIKEGLFNVIKQSMLGSVMGNMLLVLGCAFIARSCKNGTEERRKELARSPRWSFNAESANLFASLLLLCSFALAIPTAYSQLTRRVAAGGVTADLPASQDDIFKVSRGTAVVMILCYVAFLYFQVKHDDLFNGVEAADDEETGKKVDEGKEEADDEEGPKMSKWFDIIGLAVATGMIAFVSEFLVDSVQEAASSLGLPLAWVSVILLPIIGNAAEHATAVVSAYKGDMEIAIGVAVGSSIQIAGFAVPMLVIVSWMWNGSNPGPKAGEWCGDIACPAGLDMNFHPFSAIVMVLSVIVVNTIITDGRGSWLEGLALLITYVVIAVAFFFVEAGEM
eukprot:TRINITY_DN8324_c0_g1_i1.p1 TRINITY_DN8324_c0_g1~~TRINITY_DN8324_c0_g1_i1.p1  ORF type:complete len:569 (+),score=252.34 TRINITY_DN8324_c0_g1_i1:70-1776(+)